MTTTWRQKLEKPQEPQICALRRSFGGFPAGASLLVSTPQDVKAAIEAIPRGETMTPADLRARLAKAHGADVTCPVSTGIYVRMVAEVAWEDILAGADPSAVSPFWRVVDPKAPIAMKLACGPDFIRDMRASESG